MDIVTYLQGKKTYIMASLLFVYAVAGYFTGNLTLTAAIALVLGSGTGASLRAAIAKVEVILPVPSSTAPKV